MPEPLIPTAGWCVLHLFCKPTPLADAEAIVAAVKAAQGDDHQVVTVAVLGHKADLAFMALGPDLWRLRRFQTELTAAGLDVVDSYLSLTEIVGVRAGPARRDEAGAPVSAAAPGGQAGVVLLSDVEAPRTSTRTGTRCRMKSASS